MRAYELMVIFESGLDAQAIAAQVKSVAAQIATRGGTGASTDRWGRRRFAYEIDHKQEGYYVVWELTSDGGDLEALERSLRLADEVVRHKLVRLPDREALARYLRGRGLSRTEIQKAVPGIPVPLSLTKRGALIYAQKSGE